MSVVRHFLVHMTVADLWQLVPISSLVTWRQFEAWIFIPKTACTICMPYNHLEAAIWMFPILANRKCHTWLVVGVCITAWLWLWTGLVVVVVGEALTRRVLPLAPRRCLASMPALAACLRCLPFLASTTPIPFGPPKDVYIRSEWYWVNS